MFINLSPYTEGLLREELVKIHAELGAELAQAKPNGDSSKATIWTLAIGRLLTAAFGSTGVNPNPEVGRIELPLGGYHFFEPGYAEKYVAGARRIQFKNLYPQLMLREMRAGRWVVDNHYFGSVFEWLMGRARIGINADTNYTRRALLNMTYGMLFIGRKAPAGAKLPAPGSMAPTPHVVINQWGYEPCSYKLLPGSARIQLSKAETEISWLTERLYARLLPAAGSDLIAIDVDEFFVRKETEDLQSALSAVGAEYGIEHHSYGCDGVMFKSLKQRLVIDLDGRMQWNSLPKFRHLPGEKKEINAAYGKAVAPLSTFVRFREETVHTPQFERHGRTLWIGEYTSKEAVQSSLGKELSEAETKGQPGELVLFTLAGGGGSSHTKGVRASLVFFPDEPQFDLLDTESVIAALSTSLVKVRPFKVPAPIFEYKHLDDYYTMQVESYDTIVEANFVLQRVIEEAAKLEVPGEVLLFEYHNPERPNSVRRYARFFPANGLPLPERPRGNQPS